VSEASIALLVQPYKKIRPNRGAMTIAAGIPTRTWNKLSTAQKNYLSFTKKTPDRISMETFIETSKLLRKGLSPWGTSRRIYIPKPGVIDKKRPIAIPPFMDRVGQENLKVVLEAIYEPWFDKDNCSFGFRPGKNVHSAITAMSMSNRSYHHVIEGDIEAAYDRVNKKKLIEILKKRIKDSKFMKFLKNRLNYMFYDTETKEYVTPVDGVPQGGIDSPYFFNIYMKEFDKWILSHLTEKAKFINNKTRINKHTRKQVVKDSTNLQLKEKTAIKRKVDAKKGMLKITKNPEQRHTIIREIRVLQHKKRKMPSTDVNRVRVSFQYIRYADDWIILNNASKLANEKLKKEIQLWLKENLAATLSESKTLMTDIREKPAHYLGFEVRSFSTRKISKILRNDKKLKAKVAGHKVKIYLNGERLINRCYMKLELKRSFNSIKGTATKKDSQEKSPNSQ